MAIIGYGNQGRAQALNLKDSGIDVVVGLARRLAERRAAAADGIATATSSEAVAGRRLVMLLAPDETLAAIYREIEPQLRPARRSASATGSRSASA